MPEHDFIFVAGKKGHQTQLFKTEDIRHEYPSDSVIWPVTIGEKAGGPGKNYTPADVGAAIEQIQSGALTLEGAARKFYIKGANGGLWTSISTIHSQIEVCTTCVARLDDRDFKLTRCNIGHCHNPFLQLKMPRRSRTVPPRSAVCLKKLTKRVFTAMTSAT
jgi:hypothetical protein